MGTFLFLFFGELVRFPHVSVGSVSVFLMVNPHLQAQKLPVSFVLDRTSTVDAIQLLFFYLGVVGLISLSLLFTSPFLPLLPLQRPQVLTLQIRI